MKLKSTVSSLLITLLCFISNAQQWQVTEMQPMPFAISNNAVCEGYINGNPFVFSFSGIDSSKIYTGISLKSFRYDVTNNVWDTIPPLPDNLGKIAAGATTIDSIIYIIGGYHVYANGSEVSSNKVHRYNINTNSYLTDGANIPVPIDDHVQVLHQDSLIYIVTGWSNTGNVPNVQIYNTKNDSWLVGTATPNNNSYKCFGSSGAIYNDTLYYYGGASTDFNFPAVNKFRIGFINPNNPTQITWSLTTPNILVNAYRMACTKSSQGIHWLGGSAVSYNYNGIAYNGSGGVSPNNKDYSYNYSSGLIDTNNINGTLPMDLRGIASFGNNLKYIVGGMETNQEVSNKTLKLTYISSSINEQKPSDGIVIYPNPTENSLNIKTSINFNKANIYNISGIKNATISIDSSAKKIDISTLKKGAYWIQFIDEKNVTHIKHFVKL